MTSISANDGCLGTLMLATDPEIKEKGVKGRYFDVGPLGGKVVYGCNFEAGERLSALARDDAMGERLIGWSEEAVRRVLGGL